MVLTKNLITLSAGLIFLGSTALAQNPPVDIEFSGLSMKTTSGTLTVQTLNASAAKVIQGGSAVRMTDVEMNARLSEGRSFEATAPEGVIVIGGDQSPLRLASPGLARLIQVSQKTVEELGSGDMILRSDEPLKQEQDVEAQLPGAGKLRTKTLIWSEEDARFFVPTPFVQEAEQEDGSKVEIKGGGFIADKDMRDFTYLVHNGVPVTIHFKAPAAGQSTP